MRGSCEKFHDHTGMYVFLKHVGANPAQHKRFTERSNSESLARGDKTACMARSVCLA